MNLCLLLLAAIFLSSCIDEIKLDISDSQQNLVVDGLIADSLQTYEIKVNYSSSIGDGPEYVHEPVTGCAVTVLDDADNSFEFSETSPGSYTNNMKGEVGRTYFVEVKTASGDIIRSRPALLKKAPPVSDITSAVEEKTVITNDGVYVKQKNLQLRVNTNVAGFSERPRLRWGVKGEYEFKEWYPMALNPKTCYVKDRIGYNKLSIFDTHDLAGDELKDELFFTMTYNYKFAYNYCFHVFQYAVTEDEFKYWDAIGDIIDIDGSLFDPPPGTVRGNLYNVNDPNALILGYFSVAGVSYQREFTNATSLQAAAEPPCMTYRQQGRPPECNDCLLLSMSTLTEPGYWP